MADRSLAKYEHGRISVADLVPYAKNARTHSDKQVDQLVAAIKEWGFTSPVLIDEHGVLIAGHGRTMAAKKLGLAEVPFIRLVGLSDEQKRAYVLADNRIALNSGWDEKLLGEELASLTAVGFDLGLTGFTDKDIGEAIARDAGAAAGKDPDAVPDLPAAAASVAGDVWLLGSHRLMCGSSTEPADVRRLMDGGLADLVWTDPPYNVAYETKAGKIANDALKDGAFLEFLNALMRQAFEALAPGRSIYVAHADTEGLNFRLAFRTAGFKLSGCLVWRKSSLVMGRSDYQWQHEPILYGWKPGAPHRFYGGRKQTTLHLVGDETGFRKMDDGRWCVTIGDRTLVVDGEAQLEELPSSLVFAQKPAKSDLHPTMKPVELVEKGLRNSAKPGEVVLDVCGGSGTTLIAAELQGMSARLMELSPVYCDRIVLRWQEFTGRTAVLAGTSKTFAEVKAERLNDAGTQAKADGAEAASRESGQEAATA
jgi:DNA modification methylase